MLFVCLKTCQFSIKIPIFEKQKNCTMKTTKRYKLLLLLSFFLSLPSLASDSLKVKKIEYYEDGKLVRNICFDSLGRKTQERFIHYKTNFEMGEKNELTIVNLLRKDKVQYRTFKVNIYGDSVLFFNKSDLGNSYKAEVKDGKWQREDNYTLKFKLDSVSQMLPINKINELIEESFFIKTVYYDYNKQGFVENEKSIEYKLLSKKIKNKYDNSNRIVLKDYVDINGNVKTSTRFTYSELCYLVDFEYKFKNNLQHKSLNKVYLNEQKNELKNESYEFNIQNFKPIGEPKLTFTQENIYENGRIVKIIYEDLQLSKKKVHELKYEFY
jgi:hypothetical protein